MTRRRQRANRVESNLSVIGLRRAVLMRQSMQTSASRLV
jgi:hypothetical protein